MQSKRAAVRKELNKTLDSRDRERREALVSFVNAMMLYVNVGDHQTLTAQEVVYRQPRTKRNQTIQSLFEQVRKKAIEQNESHLVVSGSLAVSAPDILAIIRSAEKKQNSENTSWEILRSYLTVLLRELA